MGHSNLKNAGVAFLVPLPSIWLYVSFLRDYKDPDQWLWEWCYKHPILLANALFFFNVNMVFWVIGQIQSSHWMIDPYWTVIPVMLSHYYSTHPLLALSSYNSIHYLWRSRAVILLTWIWAFRLLHNYFRRERWQCGAREDWRFFDMRHQYGTRWWWVSFFAIYLSQQFFLMSVTIPYYVIHSVDKPWCISDFVAILVCTTGILTAYCADTQLHEFVMMNQELKQQGKPLIATLESGLWRYSRHPNYFGEQLWWWGLAIFAWSLGYGSCAFFGALVNTLCLAYVTILVEDRMLNQSYRAQAYQIYQKTTSVWVPWFKSGSSPEPAKQKST